MPEKPEVITVARHLEGQLLHQKILECHVFWDSIIAKPSVSCFCQKIVGEEILSITTRGKFLVFELTHMILLIHLRMEGKFFFRKKGDPLQKHEHVEFILQDDVSLRFHDVRKFGRMYLLPKDTAYLEKPLSELGYEYTDPKLNEDYLLRRFQNKKIPIKSVLLDQRILCGIGNIYDDEILFLSRIHPNQEACSLTKKDCSHIIQYTREVLDHAILLGGTTIRSFTSSEGVHGLFQNELLVHGKEVCPVCSSKIIKIKVQGRGTYFCPNCQKRKK